MMDKTLTYFMWGWIGLVALVNVGHIVGVMATVNDVWTGIKVIQGTYSPFNVLNLIVEVMLISPAAGAYLWRERWRKNHSPN